MPVPIMNHPSAPLHPAAHVDLAEIDYGHINILKQMLEGTHIVSGCVVTPTGTAHEVNVSAGAVRIGGKLVTIAGGNVTLSAPDATNNRFDVVVANVVGAVGKSDGTADVNPCFPDVAAVCLLAFVLRIPGDTTVPSGQILQVGTGIGLPPTYRDEGDALQGRPYVDFKGAYSKVLDDLVANTTTKVFNSPGHYDAIVDSDQWVQILSDTVASATTTSLDVVGGGWQTDQWKGCYVVIRDTTGTTLRGVRQITSNDGNTLSWTTALAGIVATDIISIQPLPIYRRLKEAVAGGHGSIFYRKASGEVDFTIGSGDAVTSIFGDNVGGSVVDVAITAQKVGLLIQNVKFTQDKALNLAGVGATVLGCQFTLSAWLRLTGDGASAVACFFSNAGGASQTPVVVEAGNNRVQACSFALQSSPGLVTATAAASGTAITGLLNLANSETGFLIDFPNNANDCTINGCLLTVPATGSGGIRVAVIGNVTGNYVRLNPTSSSTYTGIRFASRCLISGNLVHGGTVTGTNKTVNLLHCDAGAASGTIVANNFCFLFNYSGFSSPQPVFRVLLLDAGSSGVTFSGNLCLAAVAIFTTDGQPIGVDPQDSAAAELIMTNNQFMATALTPPAPWRPLTRVNPRAIVDFIPGVPSFEVYRLKQAEEFNHGAAPADWTDFGAGTTSHTTALRGGAAVLNTGTTGNKDRGIKHKLDHVSFDNDQGIEVGAHFNIDVVTNCRLWIGLAPNASWATPMSRPTSGAFLELVTDSGTVNDENGTTTSGTTATVLQDSGKAWATSQWVGSQLRYTSGPASGQSKAITANTGTTITTSAFSPAPTAGGGDTYVVESDPNSLVDSGKSWTVNYWIGHEVRITGGTGSGQTRQITGNTKTTLILSADWATIPDNTSTYTIGGWAFLIMDGGTLRRAIPLGTESTGVHTFAFSPGRGPGRHFAWFDGVLFYADQGYVAPSTLVTPGAYIQQTSSAITLEVHKMTWACDQS